MDTAAEPHGVPPGDGESAARPACVKGEAGAAASAPSPCGGAGVRQLVGPAVLFVSCWVLKRFGW